MVSYMICILLGYYTNTSCFKINQCTSIVYNINIKASLNRVKTFMLTMHLLANTQFKSRSFSYSKDKTIQQVTEEARNAGGKFWESFTIASSVEDPYSVSPVVASSCTLSVVILWKNI